MPYESIAIDKTERDRLKGYVFHDCYIGSIAMNYEKKTLILKLENPFLQYHGEFICEDCIYLNITNASIWQDIAQDYELRIAELYMEPDSLIDTLLRDTRKGAFEEKLGELYYNHTKPGHFCFTFLTTCGDKLRVVATRICWKNLGAWPAKVENKYNG